MINSRPCLQHQLKRCSAPCIEGYVSDEDYNEQVNLVKQFLSGKSQDVINHLIGNMERASEQLNFENAALYRDQISTLQKVSGTNIPIKSYCTFNIFHD